MRRETQPHQNGPEAVRKPRQTHTRWEEIDVRRDGPKEFNSAAEQETGFFQLPCTMKVKRGRRSGGCKVILHQIVLFTVLYRMTRSLGSVVRFVGERLGQINFEFNLLLFLLWA